MSTTKPRILVLGATGQVGGAVIPFLLNEPFIEVLAAARNPKKAETLGVPVVYLDLDDFDSLQPALEGIDRVFMATGYTVDMLRQSKDFVNTAVRAGVQQIVHLGACGDDNTRVAHYGWHQFIERYIASSGVTHYTHLRPEIFMQNLLGYGGESYIEHGVIRHYVGDARLSWVNCDDVAAVAAACLLQPEAHHASTYRMGYEAMDYHQVAGVLTEVVGQPFRYEAQAPEAFLKNVLAAGAEPAYMQCVYQSYRDFTDGKLVGSEVFHNLPSLIGREPKTLADLVRTHMSAFRY
jgi:NAD(P)H dehydrogenase (quinone)